MDAPAVSSRLTYEDLCRDFADVVLVQLFDGEPVVTAAPAVRHQEILGRLVQAFAAALPPKAHAFFAPLDVILSPFDVVQPDLLVILPDRLSILQEHIRGAPSLVVEVLSPGTRRLDRGVKRDLYARYGVPECWIVDPKAKTVEVYQLEQGGYGVPRIFAAGDSASSPSLPALAVDVAALFGG